MTTPTVTTVTTVTDDPQYHYYKVFDYETSDEYIPSDSTDEEDANLPIKANDKSFIIKMFGLNATGERACILIRDFKPFFYVSVGPQWERDQVVQFSEHVKKLIKYSSYRCRQCTHTHCISCQEEAIQCTLMKSKDLYEFRDSRRQKFIKMEFKNNMLMNKVKNLWFTYNAEGERKAYKFKYHDKTAPLCLYESNIPPLLRVFHVLDKFSPSGWIRFPKQGIVQRGDEYDELRVSTCLNEYVCRTCDIEPLPLKEQTVPYRICSFDIEASSFDGGFPVAIRTWKKLAGEIVNAVLSAGSASPTIAVALTDASVRNLLQQCFSKAFGLPGIAVAAPTLSITPLPFKVKLNPKKDVDRVLKLVARLETEFREPGTQVGDEEEEGGEIIMEMDEDSDSDSESEDVAGKGEQFVSAITTQVQSVFHQWLLNPAVSRVDKTTYLCQHIKNLFDGDYPLRGDEVTFIGSTLMHYDDKAPYKSVCFVVGDCDPSEGIEIFPCVDEREMLIQWAQWIRQEDPDILTGYNIFGFDYEFMLNRAMETDCVQAFVALSRKKNHLAAKPLKTGKGWALEQKKIVIASGPFDMKYFNMPGRLQIDLYCYLRREFSLASYKLDDVSAEFICDKIDRFQVAEAGLDETEIYSKNLKGLHVGDFVHLEKVEYTTESLCDGRKFRVLKIDPQQKKFVVEGTIPDLDALLEIPHATFKWGLAKDDVSPQEMFALARSGGADGRARVAKYCVQDCAIVMQLFSKIDVLTGYIEMSRICYIPIQYLVLRGQGIKLTSCLAKYCHDRKVLVPDLTAVDERDKEVDMNHDYEGAIVLPPKCGIYLDDPVACVDYSSLYPSILISCNLSQDSKVWARHLNIAREEVSAKKRFIAKGFESVVPQHSFNSDEWAATIRGFQPDKYEYEIIVYTNFERGKGGRKTVTGYTECCFARFKKGQRGILPAMLEDFLKARKETKKKAENETDEFMKNILDKRQLAYKVTANSIYGQCGSRTSTFYDKDIAACTTSKGRDHIEFARRTVEINYGQGQLIQTDLFGPLQTFAEYIYGDTDSVFFTFHLHDPATGEKIVGKRALEITIYLAQQVAAQCNESFVDYQPMELSYEKTLVPFILFTKKRYIGILYETNATKGKMKFMGLSLKRKDCCNYLKDVLGGILNEFLYEGKNQLMETKEERIRRAVDFLHSCLDRLIQGQVPMEKLTLTKALRDHYKNPPQIAHWVLAERIGERDPGNKPKPGERIKYAFIQRPVDAPKKELQGNKIETPDFIEKNQLTLNYHHYITNQLMKPITQLFGLVVEDILNLLDEPAELERYQAELVKIEEMAQQDLEIYAKKKELLSAKFIKAHLFQSILHKIAPLKAPKKVAAPKAVVKQPRKRAVKGISNPVVEPVLTESIENTATVKKPIKKKSVKAAQEVVETVVTIITVPLKEVEEIIENTVTVKKPIKKKSVKATQEVVEKEVEETVDTAIPVKEVKKPIKKKSTKEATPIVK